MSLNEMAFIGSYGPRRFRFPLAPILEHHAAIRDAIAGTGYFAPDDPPSLVANASFIYALNAYKAIGLLLPHLYHESAAVVLRQLWEVSLNLHWLALDPPTRAQDFSNFTVMEGRKIIQTSGNKEEVAAFDEATKRFQSRFWYQDGRKRRRAHSNFATSTVHDRAAELQGPWPTEYELFYSLTSMHAHGAPGAILHAIFLKHYPDPEIREQNAAALIAVHAITVIVRDVRLLARMKVIPDCTGVSELYDSFRSTITQVAEEAGSEGSAGKSNQ